MKVIVLNGIGNADTGWASQNKVAERLGIPEKNLVEFVYEDLMEKNWFNRLMVWGARIAATYYAGPEAALAANYAQDYVNDILSYFVIPGVRKKILERLASTLKAYPDSIVIGFSLGSVVAYEGIKNYPGTGGKPILITIGSTLGSPPLRRLVTKFLKSKDRSRPVLKDWFNFYSDLDLLSGRIEGLGCRNVDQFQIQATHRIQPYLLHVKSTFPQLFA